MTTRLRQSSLSARALAAQLLTAVRCQGRSLGQLLPARFDDLASADDRALVQEFCYGTLRWAPRLELFLGPLLARKIKSRDADIHSLLLLGLYQLLYMRIPAHAVVSETVTATRQLGRPWAKGLVNALLRRFIREQAALCRDVDERETGRYAHPQWLIDRLQKQYPDDWRQILVAGNQPPPMTLRVNLSRISRDAYLQRLSAAGFAASACDVAESAIVLEQAVNVGGLPGFQDGLVSVQDAAAQLAAGLLDPRPGERILDACAAPGGKSGHLLEYTSTIDLLALDRSAERLAAVTDNLRRLELPATLLAVDAAMTDDWWDGRPFDRILLDAPCSGTGVIRRHPDIKLLRRAADIDALIQQQRRLLTALWPTLRVGGRLLYVTCSLLREENSEQIAWFIDHVGDADVLPIAAQGEGEWGYQDDRGRQIRTGEHGMDGFFYGCLQKRAAGGGG